MIKSLIAHKDSVTSLSFNNNGFSLNSVSHDNSLKIWDIRKYECISEINVYIFFNIIIIKGFFSRIAIFQSMMKLFMWFQIAVPKIFLLQAFSFFYSFFN
jgi:WD40 repeat protein